MLLVNLFGALGLFLIGMWLMTEGLKLAAGGALKNLLRSWTQNRLKGLSTGILITALVQSSSAVTIATIGFVNANLMSFRQSMWVIFGSNVGTTLTAWLVTLIGFNVNISLVTFPLLGLGAFCKVFANNERVRSFGMAIAGFGLLFMGIDALKLNFSSYAENMDGALGSTSFLFALLIGCGMTILTQSSSAAIAIILTAVASGLTNIETAATAVIGANIGTTSTAILASLGATPSARRLALAHVIFNISTGVVALIFLPIFIKASIHFSGEESFITNPTVFIALFHTVFNSAGVILMLLVDTPMTRFLLASIPEPPQLEKVFIDRNTACVPDLAISALKDEISSIYKKICQQKLHQLISGKFSPKDKIKRVARLKDINQFIIQVSESNLTEKHSQQLADSLSINHYLINSHKLLLQMEELLGKFKKNNVDIISKTSFWLKKLSKFSQSLPHSDEELREEDWRGLLIEYRKVKRDLLRAVITDNLKIQSVDTALQITSLSRRYMEQLLQAIKIYETLEQSYQGEDSSQESTND